MEHQKKLVTNLHRKMVAGLGFGTYAMERRDACRLYHKPMRNREKSRQTSQNHPRQPRGECSNTFWHKPQIRAIWTQTNHWDSIVGEKDATEGIVKFLPSGFVETAADEDSADGKVVFESPILVRGAKRIEGLTLEFKHGKLVEYSARVGAEVFRKYLGSAEGDVDRFGFFAIGLNPRA